MIGFDAVGMRSVGGSQPTAPTEEGNEEQIDVTKISLARIVVFEGGGSRVVVFEGSGPRVRLQNMSIKVPVKIGERWVTDRDRDEISYYGADITNELADRNTTADPGKIVPILFGVELLEGPELQVATVEGVQRTFVVVQLGGVDGEIPEKWGWIARVGCMNGERFDKTTAFNEIDP